MDCINCPPRTIFLVTHFALPFDIFFEGNGFLHCYEQWILWTKNIVNGAKKLIHNLLLLVWAPLDEYNEVLQVDL